MPTPAEPTKPAAAAPTKKEEPEKPPIFASPQARLEYLYKDVTRLSQIATPSIVLHPADRDLHTPPRPPLVGIAAAQKHEEELVAATGGTLEMDVESINVAKDWSFGCVIGVLKAGSPCGSSGAGSASAASGCGSGEESVQNNGGGAAADGEGGDRGGQEEAEVKGGRDEAYQEGGRKHDSQRGRIEMPFCGVWRFDELGRAVEHWENAAYPEALGKWLRGE